MESNHHVDFATERKSSSQEFDIHIVGDCHENIFMSDIHDEWIGCHPHKVRIPLQNRL